MGSLAVGTIVAKNYFSFARVLANSFLSFHPHVPFFVLLADEEEGCFTPATEPFRLLRLDDLAIPHLRRCRFHYSQQELTYAATPYLLHHLLEEGFSRVAFLKQESLVLGDLAPIFAWLDRRSIVLTPHLLAPLTGQGGAARALNILLSGVYNVGFLGISDTSIARQFLLWWQERMFSQCRHAVGQGLHYEQRWLDLVPAYFADVQILRDPGFIVGHWNLPERDVRLVNNAVLVNGQPCRFFRFSGFNPDQPQAVTRYSPRLTLANVGPATTLFQRYRSLLEAAGYYQTKAWPYAYGRFDNGVPIPDLARQLYRELGDAAESFGDPFQATPPHSYFRWLNEPSPDLPKGCQTVNRLWQAVYQRRPDVQRAFPDLFGADHRTFLDWTEQSGLKEHGIPAEFLVKKKGAAVAPQKI